MKHYVTVLRSQKITYVVETENKTEAKETALLYADHDMEIPYDVSDAEYEVIACITHSEFLQYLRKDKNN